MTNDILCPICGQHLPDLERHKPPADCIFYMQDTINNLKNDLIASKKQADSWLSIANLLADKLEKNH